MSIVSSPLINPDAPSIQNGMRLTKTPESSITATISIFYREVEYSFEARLVTLGYTHKFFVMINGMEVIYEPDEERNYRAILNEADQIKVKGMDRELIKAVGEKIQLIR